MIRKIDAFLVQQAGFVSSCMVQAQIRDDHNLYCISNMVRISEVAFSLTEVLLSMDEGEFGIFKHDQEKLILTISCIFISIIGINSGAFASFSENNGLRLRAQIYLMLRALITVNNWNRARV